LDHEVTRRFADRAALVERAVDRTGLDDFGPDTTWHEGLDRLVDALEPKIYLPGARERIEGRLEGALAARLQVERWIADHPGAVDTEIEGPVIIIGLPRTATTALLNLLAVDPRWRYVRAWEAERPVPPPDIATEADDPRAAAEREWLAEDTTYAGKHIHDAGGPVDDAALLRLGFRNQELGVPAFEYTCWWRDCEMTATYAYHHKMLRLLQQARPPHRWLIKAPWHNFHLEELVATYPGARFLMTHRDPVKTIPSVCSLIQTAFSTSQPPDAVDLGGIGAFMLEHLQISIRRLMGFRDRHGDERFIDIHHAEFNQDPLAAVERIYDWLGAPLSDVARTDMTAWTERNRTGARGDHHYQGDDFGLAPDEIAAAFRPYTDRYGID
jgi:hypothetical protein